MRSTLMPAAAAFWLSLLVVFASALYFADTRMKTSDLWFRGFPALWNVVALYLYVLHLPGWLAMGIVIVLMPVVLVNAQDDSDVRPPVTKADVRIAARPGDFEFAR